MSISSILFGKDFKMEAQCIYVVKTIINKETANSRIKVTFLQDNPYSFNVYIRNANEYGQAIYGSSIIKSYVSYANNKLIFTVPPESNMILICEINKENLKNYNYDDKLIKYEIEEMEIGNNIVTDAYLFETMSGLPYQPHSMGSYSEKEFVNKTNLQSKSQYLGKTSVSRMIISHSHENERGYIDRVYVLPKRGKTHGDKSIKNKDLKNQEEAYIYLDPLQNTKNIISTSNNVIRGLMFQTSDFKTLVGRIVFNFLTTDKVTDNIEPNIINRPIYEKFQLAPSDFRNGISVASCKAQESIIYNNTLYGLGGNPTNISNPLTLRLDNDTQFIEANFLYFIVYGNFRIFLKGRSNINFETMLDITPEEIIVKNVTSLTYEAPKMIFGKGEGDIKCTWKLISTETNVELYPKFNYKSQNFSMRSDEFIDYTFYYEILANVYNVIAVTNKNDPETFIQDILRIKTVSFLLNRSDVPYDIKFPEAYPLNIYKYDDTLEFPLMREFEYPIEETVNIYIKYKLLLAIFKYIFICEETDSVLKEYVKGPKSIDTFKKDLVFDLFQDDKYNYEYIGYQTYNGDKIKEKPIQDIYTESKIGNEIFIYKFFYDIIKGQLKVKLIDTNDNLLILTKLYYEVQQINLINNYKQINNGMSGFSSENEWTTGLLPNITYSTINKLFLNENIFYEKVTNIDIYNFTPNKDKKIDYLTVVYNKVTISPTLQISFTGSGCEYAKGYRGVFTNKENIIIASISSSQGSLSYEINNDGFTGLEIITTSENLKLKVNIEDEQNYKEIYNLYLWNIENGAGGSDPHSCNGFSLVYLSAGGEQDKTYANNQYQYVRNFLHNVGSVFNNHGLSPVLKIHTNENTTSKCFEVLL